MHTPKDPKALRVAREPRETFDGKNDRRKIRAHGKNDTQYANPAERRARALTEKLTGDTLRLQQMLARLYPDLLRVQQSMADVRG